MRRAFQNSAEVIAGPKATRAEIIAALGGGAGRCISFATGLPDPDQPLKSGLLMADPSSVKDLLNRKPCGAQIGDAFGL